MLEELSIYREYKKQKYKCPEVNLIKKIQARKLFSSSPFVKFTSYLAA